MFVKQNLHCGHSSAQMLPVPMEVQIKSEQTGGQSCVHVQMYRSAGWRSFFKGFDVAMMRSFPANAACFVGYEAACRVLGNR